MWAGTSCLGKGRPAALKGVGEAKERLEDEPETLVLFRARFLGFEAQPRPKAQAQVHMIRQRLLSKIVHHPDESHRTADGTCCPYPASFIGEGRRGICVEHTLRRVDAARGHEANLHAGVREKTEAELQAERSGRILSLGGLKRQCEKHQRKKRS